MAIERPKKLLKRAFVQTLESRLKEEDPLIQVILGPRQVGKTTGVQMLSGFGDSLYYTTADDSLSQVPEWIIEQWQAAKLHSKSPILIIDEIQKVIQWSERIKALWDAERRKQSSFKLVLLGSSSLGLQKGLEESLTGRFEVIQVYHWNFDESHRQFGFSLDDFLLYGGYPESARFVGNYKRWRTYLKNSIVETVVGKDILRQSAVRKPALFRQTFELLASYPAQMMSYNKLLGQLQEGGNTDLIKTYIELFEGAFLFRSVQKFSGSKIKQKNSSPKIFPLCPCLYSYQLSGKELMNPEIRGRIFEAAVGAELARLPGELFYWRESDTSEVDFVYLDGTKILAIEVKSGRRKSSRGISDFLKKHPKASPVFVTPENFAELSKSPEGFLKQML